MLDFKPEWVMFALVSMEVCCQKKNHLNLYCYIVIFLGVLLWPLDCGDLKKVNEICTNILDRLGFATKLELENFLQRN